MTIWHGFQTSVPLDLHLHELEGLFFAAGDVEGAQKSLVMSGKRTGTLLAGFGWACGGSGL